MSAGVFGLVAGGGSRVRPRRILIASCAESGGAVECSSSGPSACEPRSGALDGSGRRSYAVTSLVAANRVDGRATSGRSAQRRRAAEGERRDEAA
jgi:hypothetical protein